MTIIEPKKRILNTHTTLVGLTALILLTAILNVFAYNTSVNLKHHLHEAQTLLTSAEEKNLELQNELYAMLDFHNLDYLVEATGLVRDGDPDFFLALQ